MEVGAVEGGDSYVPQPLHGELNLARFFLAARLDEGRGDRVALHFLDQKMTYQSLLERSRRLASLLLSPQLWQAKDAPPTGSLRPEERVVLLGGSHGDTIDIVSAYFAILWCGAVVVMPVLVETVEDVYYYLRYARSRLVIATPEVATRFAETLCEVADRVFVLPSFNPKTGESIAPPPESTKHPWQVSIFSYMHQEKNENKNEKEKEKRKEEEKTLPLATMVTTNADDPAVWLFTSGTSGRPKACVHTHRSFVYCAETYGRNVLQLTQEDITACDRSLTFGYGMGINLLFPFAVGASVVLAPERLCVADRMFAAIERYGPTVLGLTPSTARLLCMDSTAQQRDLSRTVRYATSASEALPASVYRQFLELFGVEILDGIGSSEMAHIFISNRAGKAKPGSVGELVPGYRVRLVGPDGHTEVQQGDVGTMWVAGGSAAIGYHGAYTLTKEVWRGEWFVTEDQVMQDSEGYYWYCGRARDMLKLTVWEEGANLPRCWVSPLEIEDALLQHESVREVAVVGQALEDGEVVPKAFVVLASSTSSLTDPIRLLQQLKLFCISRGLARHELPQLLEIVDTLPRNSRGKVDRKALRYAPKRKAMTLAEALRSRPTMRVVTEKERRDRSQPKRELKEPSVLEVEQLKKRIHELNIDHWYPHLSESLTFKTVFIEVSMTEAKAMLSHYDRAHGKSSSHWSIPLDEEQKVLEGLEGRVGAAIEEVGGKAFVKACSRSPKDAVSILRLVKDLAQRELDELLMKTPDTKEEGEEVLMKAANAAIEKVISEANQALVVSSGKEALNLLLTSERIYEDLDLSLEVPQDWNVTIQVREFVSLPVDSEWRCFVYDGKMTAVSQFWHCVYFDKFSNSETARSIGQQIVTFYRDRVASLLSTLFSRATFVLDVAVLPDAEIKIIELNPYADYEGCGTDDALFNWYADSALLRGEEVGAETPAVRVREALHPDALKLLRSMALYDGERWILGRLLKMSKARLYDAYRNVNSVVTTVEAVEGEGVVVVPLHS